MLTKKSDDANGPSEYSDAFGEPVAQRRKHRRWGRGLCCVSRSCFVRPCCDKNALAATSARGPAEYAMASTMDSEPYLLLFASRAAFCRCCDEHAENSTGGNRAAGFECRLHAFAPQLGLFRHVVSAMTAQSSEVAPQQGSQWDSALLKKCSPPGARAVFLVLAAPEIERNHRPSSWNVDTGCAAMPQRRSLNELEDLLRTSKPELLLFDLQACNEIGAAPLGRLRRAQPSTRWIIGRQTPSTGLLPAVLNTGARMCLEWQSQPEVVRRGLEAEQGGGLWFPREITRELYDAVQRLPGLFGNSASVKDPVATFSPRELEVVALLQAGFSNKEMAARLGITVNTVKKHVQRAFAKSGTHGRRQLHF